MTNWLKSSRTTRISSWVIWLAGRKLAASTDGDGNVLFGGGGSYSAVVDRYTPSGTRTTLTTLSAGRTDLAASADGAGNVLFGGGYTGSYSAVVNSYTPSGTRTNLSNLSVVRAYLAASTDGIGRVFFGGGHGPGDSNRVDCYTSDGTRSILPALSESRTQLAAATDKNGKVLFGGGGMNSPHSAVVDRYYQTAQVKIPAYYSYQFPHTASIQSPNAAETTIEVAAPSVGYLYPIGETTL